MPEKKEIPCELIDFDPGQPRKLFDDAEIRGLSENIKAIGLQVAVIVYAVASRFVMLDGERRLRAYRLLGLERIEAIVLLEKPSPLALHLVQMSLEVHRKGLNDMERSDFLHQIRMERNWNVSELAQNLQMKQPVCSKLLLLQKLHPELKQRVRDGKLDLERGFMLSAVEPDKQLELAGEKLSRVDLRNRVRKSSTVKTASFALPNAVISIKANDLTMKGTVEVLQAMLRIAKKHLNDGLDVSTAQKVMADQARVS